MEEKLDQHNVQLAQVYAYKHTKPVVYLTIFQVTEAKGFEILDEAALQSVIEQM